MNHEQTERLLAVLNSIDASLSGIDDGLGRINDTLQANSLSRSENLGAVEVAIKDVQREIGSLDINR